MYRKILVPLDGSGLAEAVLPYVRLLGEALQSTIELLYVVDPSHQAAGSVGSDGQAYLKHVEARLRGNELTTSFIVREGSPSRHIVNEAGVEPDTLIAMSTHALGGLAPGVLGRVVKQVLHTTNNPTLIVPSQDPEAVAPEAKLRNIIVPLDGSSLAEQILPYVAPLAKNLRLNVIPVRATPAVGDNCCLTIYPTASDEELTQGVDEQAVEYLQEAGQQLRQHGLASIQECLLHGDPAVAIVYFAQQTPHSLIAMTTHGRSGLGPWPIGGVTDLVERHSGSPMLIIRPVEQGTS